MVCPAAGPEDWAVELALGPGGELWLPFPDWPVFNGGAVTELEITASEAPCQLGSAGDAPEVWLFALLLGVGPLKLGVPLKLLVLAAGGLLCSCGSVPGQCRLGV